MRTLISPIRCIVALLFIALSPMVSMALSKTITVNPKIPVNAVTTWYYQNCNASAGIGSYTMITPPIHGSVSYSQLSGPLPGCPAGSPSLPAVAAFYTWTDTKTPPPASDFFSVLYQAPDGETEEDDITVELPACAISVDPLANVPGGDNEGRITFGVGEAVLLKTNISADWSITSGPIEDFSDGTVPLDISRRNGENFPAEDCAPQTADPVAGPQACFKAPYSPGTTVVTATAQDGGGSCSVTLTTVQPQGLIMRRIQYPSLASPDYRFVKHFFGSTYDTEMETAIFVTPANVSFAYIHFKELDRKDPFFGYAFNSLYSVDGSNAWLLNCDYDHQEGRTGESNSRVDKWVFADWDGGHETPFATEETTWSESPDPPPNGITQFSKYQISILNADGTTTPTPLAPKSTLLAPAVDYSGLRGIGNHKECETQLGVDFTPIQ